MSGRAPLPGPFLSSIPNLITLARILSVPIVVWAITSGECMVAFILFLAAGISDAVDGFLAKRFNMASELGAYLDPLADKALIVSIYVSLGIAGAIPRWLVIFVVSRDIMIIGAVILTWLLGRPMEVKPLMVSKLNTGAQIVFACLVLVHARLRIQSRFPAAADDRRGRRLDLPVGRLLSRRMDPPYRFGGRGAVSTWPKR